MQGKRTINSVLRDLPRSGLRRLTDEVMRINQDRGNVIQLGFGQPQEPPDEGIRKAIIDAASHGSLAYTENAGFPELKNAIRLKLKKENGINVEESDIFVTPGATYGVTIAIGCLIEPNDEVLVPDPGYPNFGPAVRHYGGLVKHYSLAKERGFLPDLEQLISQISSSTKLLVINSPCNPTGSVMDKDMIREILAIAERYNIWLLSDEVYESYVYEGDHVSPLSFQNSEYVVGVFSFSKTYNMTGLRVGYIVTQNKELGKALLNAQELYISCAPSTSQMAACHALKACNSYAHSMREEYRRKRDLAIDCLEPYIGHRPQGAFYLLINIDFTGFSSDEFADRLLQEKLVAVAPGATFGPTSDKYIRVAFTPQYDVLREGLLRLREFLDEQDKIRKEELVGVTQGVMGK